MQNAFILVLIIVTFLILILFLIRQQSTGHYFPQIKSHWLTFVFPLSFVILALFTLWIVESNDLSNALTVVFGIASIASLVLSIAVLITVRQTFRDELQLMEAVTDLLQSAQSSLTFIVLTPNIGYAKAISREKWNLIKAYEVNLIKKLKGLIETAKSNNGKNIRIRIGVLGDADIDAFIKMKESGLLGYKPEYPAQDHAGNTYTIYSKTLKKRLQEIIQQGRLELGSDVFRYEEWQPKCINWENQHNPQPNFPPLNVIIADDKKAVICYNEQLISPQPVDLEGRILTSPEEIDFYSAFVDSYLDNYRRKPDLYLMEGAIDLLQLVQTNLTFVVLTPNIGYAKSISHQRWGLIDKFDSVLIKKLNELIDKAKSSKNKDIRIKIAMLGDSDRKNFFKKKEEGLQNLPPEHPEEKNAAQTYSNRTNNLMKQFEEIINKGRELGSDIFRYEEWQPNCINWENQHNPQLNFPPLSLVIGDSKLAIIYYNTVLISKEPSDPGGQILKLSEEIESFSLLVDFYIDRFMQNKKR